MARPLGSTSHWWTIRKRLSLHLYDPTDEAIERVRQLVRELNDEARNRRGV